MTELEGDTNGYGLRIGIVVARFNNIVTSKLLEGAIEALLRHKVLEKDITAVWVPGAFEIPLAASKLCRTEKFDAIVCLGAVVRGDTPHFDYVAAEASRGVARVGLKAGLPVMFGVLTTNDMEQALDRAGGKVGNKGYEASVAAIQMANLLKKIGSSESPPPKPV